MTIPENADLSRKCVEIAEDYKVSITTAYEWKKAAGIPMRKGGNGIRKGNLARHVSMEDWAEGCHHVAKLLGISPQAAWLNRNQLIKEGYELPKLKRGRGRKIDGRSS